MKDLKTPEADIRFKNLLLEKRSILLKKWFQLILETYPADTMRFLKDQKNKFSNPVGHTIRKGIEGIFEELTNEMDSERVSTFLDNIIRIRAIQDFSPSRAISFVFLLKKVIREELESEILENKLSDELLKFESKIDDLALLSFDIYMKCRERIYELKANELKNMYYRLLQKANLIYEIQEEKQEEKSDSKDSNIVNLK
ncbi:MAG: RsbRD N-terminal domain-containing protein [Nitrospirota bacterium]